KGWFGNRMAFAQGPLPAITSGTTTSPPTPVLAVVSVTDAGAASAWVRKALDELKATYTTADHAGTSMLVLELPQSPQQQAAIAVRGQALLIGDRASVERSIDGNG